MTDRQDKGVTPTGSGCSPTASAVPASCKQSIPDAGWPAGVDYTIKSDDVIWTMDWSARNEDGSRRYPDKPEAEEVFEEGGALAVLLVNEQVFLNAPWWEKEWPEKARRQIGVHAVCNDIFAWACADAETVEFAEIEGLYREWLANPKWGTAAWCIRKRGVRPQPPVERAIVAAGYNIDALLAQGIEARRAETTGSVHESPVGNADAPERNPHD